ERASAVTGLPRRAPLTPGSALGPRNEESAGNRRSPRLRKGAPWLKTTLIQCAWGATRKAGSYLQAQFYRLRARRGAKKAVCAVAASILTAIYHMLKTGTFYHDLGAEHFQRRASTTHINRLLQKLSSLGYEVMARKPTDGIEIPSVSF